ncbi:MAG: hypothetical protein ACR2OX_02365 [Methyloligellaceae bacterium]
MFGIVGGLSGLLSAELIYLLDNLNGVLLAVDPSLAIVVNFGVVPGLTFGFMAGAALKIKAILPRSSYLTFVVISAVSNLISFFVYAGTHEALARWAAGYVAGLAGSGCFAIAVVLLISPAKRVAAFVFLTLIGGLLGTACALIFVSSTGLWIFLALWQLGYAATLYGFLKSSREN